MGIKNRQVFFLLLSIILVFSSVLIDFNSDLVVMCSSKEINENQTLKTSDEVLIDKVYNFTTTFPSKTLEDIQFITEYNYYIYFKVVTPHQCNITISIVDPAGSIYDVFHKEDLNQGDGLQNFPFGAALTGPHDITFNIELEYNLNFYIKIEKTIKCLFDVLSPQQITNIKQYGVEKFEEFRYEWNQLVLLSDTEYHLYFARVSPISILLDNQVEYNYSLKDESQNILFELNWQDETLAGIGSITKYIFGTAFAGLYHTNLSISYDLNPVNIVFAIVLDHEIGSGIGDNDIEPDNSTTPDFLATIPQEMLAGVFFLGGGLVAIAFVGVAKKKKRSGIVGNV